MEFEDVGWAGQGWERGRGWGKKMERRDVQYGAAGIGTGLDGRLLRELVCLLHSGSVGSGLQKKFASFMKISMCVA